MVAAIAGEKSVEALMPTIAAQTQFFVQRAASEIT